MRRDAGAAAKLRALVEGTDPATRSSQAILSIAADGRDGRVAVGNSQVGQMTSGRYVGFNGLECRGLSA